MLVKVLWHIKYRPLFLHFYFLLVLTRKAGEKLCLLPVVLQSTILDFIALTCYVFRPSNKYEDNDRVLHLLLFVI